jgi:hypothetical protein
VDVRCDGFDRLDAQTKEHGRAVIEALFAAFDRNRTNPVRVPAEEFRRLMWPAGIHPENWRQIIQSTLGSLQHLTLVYTTPSGRKGQDRFLSSCFYFGQEAELDNSWLREALDQALGLEGPGNEDVYVVNFASMAANPKARAELLSAAKASGYDAPPHTGLSQSPTTEGANLPSRRHVWHPAIKGLWPKLRTIIRIK